MKCKLDKNGECLNGRCPEFLFKCKIPCDYIVPMTNADRIRAMTDEELAAWIVETTYICACCSVIEGCQDAPHVSVCKKNVAEWLRQPHKPKEEKSFV